MGLYGFGGSAGSSASPLHFRPGLEEPALVDVLLERLTVEPVFPGACGGADRILTRRWQCVVSYGYLHLGAFDQLQRLKRSYLALVVAGFDRLDHHFSSMPCRFEHNRRRE